MEQIKPLVRPHLHLALRKARRDLQSLRVTHLETASLGDIEVMAAEQADGSNYRDDSETIDESADGSNYRDDSEGISEVADGSNDREPTSRRHPRPLTSTGMRDRGEIAVLLVGYMLMAAMGFAIVLAALAA